MPLGRSRIIDPYPVGISISAEGSRQRQAGIDQLYAGAGNFTTSPKSATQMYMPMRFLIASGRGANTSGSISGAATVSTEEYEPKAPSLQRAAKRGG
jgi:hypothetical protein